MRRLAVPPTPMGGVSPESPAKARGRADTIVLEVAGGAAPAAGLLRQARRQAGISQAELARRAGVPASMVSAYERNLRQPSLGTLMRLVHAAGYALRVHLELLADHPNGLAAMDQNPWDEHRTESAPASEGRQRARVANG